MGAIYPFAHLHQEGAGAFVCGEETALIRVGGSRAEMPRCSPPFPRSPGLWGSHAQIQQRRDAGHGCLGLSGRGGEAFASFGTGPQQKAQSVAFGREGPAARAESKSRWAQPSARSLKRSRRESGGAPVQGRCKSAGPRAVACLRAGRHAGGLRIAARGWRDHGFRRLGRCSTTPPAWWISHGISSSSRRTTSCGKCTFCRIGTKRMLELLNRFCGGSGPAASTFRKLEQTRASSGRREVCAASEDRAQPGAPAAIFRDEYEAHLPKAVSSGQVQRPSDPK